MSEGNGQGDARPEAFREGLRLLHEGRAEEAVTLLEPLHANHPQDAEIALNLGGAYVLRGHYDAAREILEQAAQLAPDNVNVWINLGAARLGPLAESDAEEQDGAILAYQQALTVNPDVPNVHYMLGLIYRRRKDDLRAAAHFTRALEQDPNDNDARRMLAAIAATSSRKHHD